jgi:ABC-type oligopeptide transport system substrate-binding subunit
MTILSRSISRLVARTSLVVVMLSFAVFGAWTVGGLLGQPSTQDQKRVEEEEDKPKTQTSPGKKQRIEEEEETPRTKRKRKVIHVEEEESPKTKPGTNQQAGPAASGDLSQLAEQTTHPELKELFRSLAVPHDHLKFQPSRITTSGERRPREEKIVPIPFYLGNDPGLYRRERLRFTPLTLDWQPGKPFEPIIENLEFVRPYEEIAQDKVRDFLRKDYDIKDKNDLLYLSRYDMLKAAEQVLSSVLRWHESAIQTGKRRGKEWDKVEQGLRKQLLNEVLLKQMELLAQARDWNRVLDLTRRLAVSYGNTDERIFQPVAGMIGKVLSDPTSSEETKKEALRRLHELEMEFPDNKAFRPFGELLRACAEDLLKRAREIAGDKKDPRNLQIARQLLYEAEQTWPQLPELRSFKRELGWEYPILRVGVRGPLPKYFSPAWACTDNERRIIEMLFEGLVKRVPDEAGGFCYRPALAEALPQVVPLGRQFDLPRNAFWSDGRRLNAIDIRNSLDLLKSGKGVGLSRVWGTLLDDMEPIKAPYQVMLRLKQGFLDPLAPMTFKILPSDARVPVISEEFARRPVTSGPFLLDLGRSRQSDETKRECLVFVANPYYGQRRTKRGLPHIQEIRFYTHAGDAHALAADLRKGRLDLVLDLTAKEAEELKKQGPDLAVPMPSPAVPNRRIYFLALNTRKLDNAKLRQALSCAIDREGLLNKYFRAAGKTPLHKVLCGPFPAGSWACKPENEAGKARQTLFDPERAKLLIQNVNAGPFKLKYAADDPNLDEAMKDLCSQVKKWTGVVLEPTPVSSPYQLREDVEQTKNYDLAYYHYDFPDELFWLGPLLGPPPETDDLFNIFKFYNGDLTNLLTGTKSHRNFTEVRSYQWQTQEQLNREMPFIPLWQLDPLLAYQRDVQPAPLDPLLLFSNIEEWRLLPR